MDRFDSIRAIKNADPFIGTISDELDRVEAKAGKIGMNPPDQAFAILQKLDTIDERLRSMESSQSRKVAETQFESITTKIRKEADLFLRDLGGVGALRKAREQVSPPAENWWWYLDTIVAERRRASVRRSLIWLGSALVALLVLIGIYQAFLAPDPIVAAVYTHEKYAQDLMMAGDLENALVEVEKGLSYDPINPTLLVYQGVLLESLGRESEAQQSFSQAEKGVESRKVFLVTRGQAYVTINQPERAKADVEEAIQLDPEMAEAYLLSGQINEITKNYQQALADYDKAFTTAEKDRQFELAALARTRTAMLYQIINTQVDFPTEEPPTE